jgi:NTP pyrophosphatase (non-canonical NTP hydrolase)
MSKELQDVIDKLIKFRNDRHWQKYHTTFNLVHALMIEAAELAREFIWNKQPDKERVSMELADVLIYTLYLCEAFGLDPIKIINAKIAINESKYDASKDHEWDQAGGK